MFRSDPELRPTAVELLDHQFCDLDEEFDYGQYVEEQKARILEEEMMYDDALDGSYTDSEPMDIDSEGERRGFEFDASSDSAVEEPTFLPLTGGQEPATAVFLPGARTGDSMLTPILDTPVEGYSDSGWMSGSMAAAPEGGEGDDDVGGKVVSIDDEGSLTPARSRPDICFEDQVVPSDASDSATPTATEFSRPRVE